MAPVVQLAATLPMVPVETVKRNVWAIGKHGFEVDCDKFAEVGERDMIFAKSGMGKSYLSGLMMEATLDNDGVICVVDPQNETYTLAWKYPMLVVGGTPERLIEQYNQDAELPKEEQQYTKAERELGIKKALERIPVDYKVKEHYTNLLEEYEDDAALEEEWNQFTDEERPEELVKPTYTEEERQEGIQRANERLKTGFELKNFSPQPGDTKKEKLARQVALKLEIELLKEGISLLVETMLTEGVSLIFDHSEQTDEEAETLFAFLAESLFQHQNHYKRKMRLVVEEVQQYAPQKGGNSISLPWLIKIAKMGRKLAIDLICGTQRPASLSKDVMSQGSRFWFGGLSAKQDHTAVQHFLEEAGIAAETLSKLTKGQFYYWTNGEEPELIETKKRKCRHAGATPKAKTNSKVANKSKVKDILNQIKNGTESEETEEETITDD
jgi:hypothetical protein